MDALSLHRFHFAFTISYHYLFPQLTMGLALMIFIWKTLALRSGCEEHARAARFWTRLFGLNFAMGVATGVPMEFQFGTNWAPFSKAAGGVIGQMLAMEGLFSFFLESTFLGFLLFGEKKLGPRGHWFASLCVFVGSWLSGYFIVATDAFMQHPVGYTEVDGVLHLSGFWALLSNPWLVWQYPHTMLGSLVTSSFVVASIGSFYLLAGRHGDDGKTFLRLAVPLGLAASLLVAFTGDGQGGLVAKHQPATLAAMEGLFTTEEGAPLVLIGQPDMEKRRLDNPIHVPGLLSFLTYKRWGAEVRGLDEFPEEDWPDAIPLLYYSFHIMVGLGTFFILIMAAASWLLRGGRLFAFKPMLWVLALSLPFPYIANTAGWTAAELGRQPWVIYGLMRTADGYSANVSAGNTMFSLLGFMGLYALLTFLFLLLAYREIEKGPAEG